MRLALDTNAWSAIRRGDQEVARRLRGAEEIFVSAVVVGELLQGFLLGTRWEQNRSELENFLQNPFVRLLSVTLVTAEHYARIWAQLRRAGTPIPTNDVWIAAHAIEAHADLLSFDGHFSSVEGLSWIRPTTEEVG